jgi:hypothetical protein
MFRHVSSHLYYKATPTHSGGPHQLITAVRAQLNLQQLQQLPGPPLKVNRSGMHIRVRPDAYQLRCLPPILTDTFCSSRSRDRGDRDRSRSRDRRRDDE